MEKVLNYQISLFGSFINIQPDPKITAIITQNLKSENLIPSIAVVNVVDPIKQQVTAENRLQMESIDHSWRVLFFADRIDINYTFPGGDIYYRSIDEVVEKGKHICKLVFKDFSDTVGNRLATNGRFLVKDLSEDERNKFINSFAVIPEPFKDNTITELNFHFNAPKEVLFSDKKEYCNNIIEIFDFIGYDQNNNLRPRMAIGLDINTDQNNADFKYKYLDLLEFCDASCNSMKTILNEIEGDIL